MAEDWDRIYTRGSGSMAIGDGEDQGIAFAVGELDRLGRADATRLLILRTVSNFTIPPPGVRADKSLFETSQAHRDIFEPSTLTIASATSSPRRSRSIGTSTKTEPNRTAEVTMVKGIAFTAYPSNDVAGTRRWYEEKLGLQFAGPYVEDDVEKYNEAHIGSACFGIMAAEWTGRMPGSASSIYFEVDDLEEMIASLQAKGVTIDDRFEGPVCKQASFCDPDGNKVNIHESTRS